MSVEQLYLALQLLLDRDGDVSREEVDDAAVWATQILDRELIDRTRARACVRGIDDAVALLWDACLAAHTVHLGPEQLSVICASKASPRSSG